MAGRDGLDGRDGRDAVISGKGVQAAGDKWTIRTLAVCGTICVLALVVGKAKGWI